MEMAERNMSNGDKRGIVRPAGVLEHVTRKEECTGSWEIPPLARGKARPWSASGR